MRQMPLPVILLVAGVTCFPLLAADPPAVDPAAAMAAAMAALGQAAEQNAAAGEAIDAKAMKALLPDKEGLAGFKRVKVASEIQAVAGFRVSTATAEFTALEGEGSLRVQFQDIGAFAALARAAAQMQEIDEETENGFRRTAVYSGFKGEEEYDGDERNGSIKLIVGERVSVEVSGSGVSFATLKAVMEKLDLKALSALKPVAAAASGEGAGEGAKK